MHKKIAREFCYWLRKISRPVSLKMVGNFIETLILRRVEDCLIPSIFVGYSVVISTRVLKYGWKNLRGTGAMLWGIYYNEQATHS